MKIVNRHGSSKEGAKTFLPQDEWGRVGSTTGTSVGGIDVKKRPGNVEVEEEGIKQSRTCVSRTYRKEKWDGRERRAFPVKHLQG